MSDTTRGHDRWTELAAGHAVHALEPDEESRLSLHLADCEQCRRTVDDFTLVAAQLGSLTDSEGPAPAWEAIRAQVLTATDAPPVVHLAARRRRRPAPAKMLAAAAAVTALAAGGVLGVHSLMTPTAPSTTSALAACQAQSGCHLVTLHGQRDVLASVLVRGDQAQLVPTGLRTPADNRVYVLWQLPRDGGPIPLMEFGTPASNPPIGTLARPYTQTAAFAVSLEPAATMPTQPTTVLATGAAGT